MNMISFANFTPQEAPRGEFPDLLNDESASAAFDAFLNLFVVVPQENTMFSGSEIPQELNESPIGLQATNIPESETFIDPAFFDQPIDPTLEKTQPIPSETPQAFLGANQFDPALEKTQPIPSEIPQAFLGANQFDPALEKTQPIPSEIPQAFLGANQFDPALEKTQPIPSEIPQALFGSNQFDPALETKLLVNDSITSRKGSPQISEPPIPQTETATPLSAADLSIENPARELPELSLRPLEIKALNDIAGSSNLLDPLSKVVSQTLESESPLLPKDLASFQVQTPKPLNGEAPILSLNSPAAAEGQKSQVPQATPSLQAIPTPTQDSAKPNSNPIAYGSKPDRLANPASSPSVAEALGFRVLSTDEKPGGLGRAPSDVQTYSALTNKDTEPQKRQNALPRVSEIINETKVGSNEPVKIANKFDFSADPSKQAEGLGTDPSAKDGNKPFAKLIGEKSELEAPKKPAASLNPNLDLGAMTKEISSQKFEPLPNIKSIGDVQAKAMAEQLETPLLDLASLETDSEDPKLLKFRLRPAELGSIEIRLEKNLAGKLEVHFQAENDTAKHILRESFEHLRNSLQNAGWQVEQMEVSSSSLSPNGFDSREDKSRKNESTSPENSALVDENPESDDDLTPKDPNRLVSLRA